VGAILHDPEGAKVPDSPAALYALCGALAKEAWIQSIDPVVTYANRLPAEFSVLLMRDAISNDPEIQNTRAFAIWASENQDVLV
jgi:hypothetical protein